MKFTSKIVLSILIILASFSFNVSFGQNLPEKITNYESNITINNDGSLDILEIITINSNQNIFKHGIYKDFYIDKLYGNNYSQRYTNIVARLNDTPISTFTKNIDGNLRIYIGDSNKILTPGLHKFTFFYTVLNEIAFYDDHDEIFYNINGTWDVSTDKLSGSIKLPPNVDYKLVKINAFQGYPGSKNKFTNYKIENNYIYYSTTKSLNNNEVISIAIWFPKGTFNKDEIKTHPPQITDNIIYLVPLGLLIISLLNVFFIFKRNGNNTLLKNAPATFEIPAKFTPADFRFIFNKKGDTKSFTAEIINLAVKNVIKISKDPEDPKAQNIIFTLLDKTKATNDLEHKIIDKLFSSKNDIKTLDKSDLKSLNEAKFLATTEPVFKKYLTNKNLINRTIIAAIPFLLLIFVSFPTQSLFNGALIALLPFFVLFLFVAFFYTKVIGNLLTSKSGYISLLIFTVLLTVLLFVTYSIVEVIPFTTVVLFVLSFVPYLIFEFYNSGDFYTEAGLELKLLQIGFMKFANSQREYLGSVFAEMPLTFEMYEKYLPYAVALDIETLWSKKFNEVLKNLTEIQKVELEKFSYDNLNFIHYSINNSLNTFNISQARANARSSSYSGGGFSSGGSSGGGGGSAGGGGW